MRTVTSRQNPVVRAFRDLATDPPGDGSRLLLDGLHLVEEARAAGLGFERVAIAAAHLDDGSRAGAAAAALAREGADVVAVTAPVMNALSPVRAPAGIVAIAVRRPAALEAICRQPGALVIAAVDVQDPGNIGALLRAAEAFGATGAVVSGASASPFSWKAVRGSMGSVLRLPVVSGVEPQRLIAAARESGLHVVASVPRGGAPPESLDWSSPTLLVLGGEGSGLSDTLLASADDRVTIPMRPPVESLNVAVAAGVLVHEAGRRRALAGPPLRKAQHRV